MVARTAAVELINPRKVRQNKDNPRLIFRQDELNALEDSIREQGILVPITVFRERTNYTLLDGERRWRCALRLGLHQVPAIVQEKPDRKTNIMMMFAIHNARQDWDPLPAALKMEELEKILAEANGKRPTDKQLGAAASLSVGEVRRYRTILALPNALRKELMSELERPRSEQRLTVDHVIEAVAGAARLVKADVIREEEKQPLVTSIVDKFRSQVLHSTVEPRKLARVARAVERQEIDREIVKSEIRKFARNPSYTIDAVFRSTVEQEDFAHGTEQLVRRSLVRLKEMRARRIKIFPELQKLLEEFIEEAQQVLI